jgi:hypothetical protein
MGLLATIVKALFLAGGLALWNLYLQPIYEEWLKMQGKVMGFGELMLGYTFTILISWGLAAIITRKLERNGDEK